jgi:hypothetical protein
MLSAGLLVVILLFTARLLRIRETTMKNTQPDQTRRSKMATRRQVVTLAV